MRPRKIEMTARAAVVGLLLLGAGSGPAARAAAAAGTDTRPRVIISSDFPPLDVIPVRGAKPGHPPEKCSDPDDVQSMVRILLYTNELDVEGLIASAGMFANIARRQNILDLLDVYDRVDENMRRHDSRYPDADRLRAVTWQGRDGAWGTPDFGVKSHSLESILGEGKDSEASDAIIRIVDRPDPRPVWFCAWGGSREVAQAIWTVRATRSPAELERFLGKLRLYLIARQDITAQWLLDSFPSLFVILSQKNYQGMFWNIAHSDPRLADLTWINAHIREGHGPLGSVYPQSGWDPQYPGVQEGDTPSFMNLVSALRGLNDPGRPDQGGWGGRFVQPDPARNHWFDAPEGTQSVSRWREHYQNEFATRIDWTLSNNAERTNHRPVAVLNGDTTTNILEMTARSGETVPLSAEGSHDPDGDALELRWRMDRNADSQSGGATESTGGGGTLSSSEGLTASLRLPKVTKPRSIQVILKVGDRRVPSLWAYRRAIIHLQP